MKPVVFFHQSFYPAAHFLVTRTLGDGGRALVKVGDWVMPGDIVGIAKRTGSFLSFRLAKILGVKPSEAESHLVKTLGSRVYKGELIAVHKIWHGLKQIEFYAPIDGILQDYHAQRDQLLINSFPQRKQVPAAIPGQVVEVTPGRKIRIRTLANLIRGRLGAGPVKEGFLDWITNEDMPIPAEKISANLKGRIIAGGSLVSSEVMHRCLAAGVRGVITGGIQAHDFMKFLGGSPRQRHDTDLSLTITGGFGNHLMAPEVAAALKESVGKYVLLNGNSHELLIPLEEQSKRQKPATKPGSKPTPPLRRRFMLAREGQRVRLLSDPESEVFGIIRFILPNQRLRIEVEAGKTEVWANNVEAIL